MIGGLGEVCDTCTNRMMYVDWLHIRVGCIVHCAQVRVGGIARVAHVRVGRITYSATWCH